MPWKAAGFLCVCVSRIPSLKVSFSVKMRMLWELKEFLSGAFCSDL